MTSFFTLELDTRAPATPSLVINGGAAVTGSRVVQVDLSSADYQAGARDVTEMKLWGSVDITADSLVGTTEDTAVWQSFNPTVAVMLSDLSGRKYLNARLRDDVGNETVAFSDFIDLDLTSPVVEITTAIDRGRISKVPPFDTAIFGWQSSQPFTDYQVRVVPSIGSPVAAGALIGSGHGSTNITDSGSFAANTPITTIIKGADLEAASPGDTTKVVKVFVRAAGVWSP